MIERLARAGTCLVASVAVAAGAALAQPLLVIETAPMSQLAPDPLDAGLARAIGMLPNRVEELSSEIPNLDRSVTQLIARVLRTVSRPMTIAIVHDPDIAGPTMGYGAVLSFAMDGPEMASELQRELVGALANAPEAPTLEPSPHGDGMMQFSPPQNGPTIVFGPRQAGGAWHYEVHLGFVDQTWDLLGKPDEAHKGIAVVRMSLNLEALSPVLEMGGQQAEQANERLLRKMLDDVAEAGVAGDGAMSLDMAMSYQADHCLTTVRMAELGKLWSMLSLPSGAINREHFKAVPADAWTASFSRFDLEMLRAIVGKLDEYEVPASQYLDYFAQSTGISLFDDIVAPLGGDAIVYRSESTGGGGLLSSVMLLQVRDRAKMLETNEKVTNLANMMAMMVPIAGKYIRLTPWKYDDIDLFSLRFQGVPVPLEITFGYEGDWMLLTPTPQAAIAAVRQLRGRGDRGLGTVEAFTSQLPRGQDLYSVSFVNADRVAHAGYGMTALIGSGLANMVRSPWDRSRDPGLVVPPYNDLKQSLRSAVSWSYWDGSTLEYRAVAGRSMLGNMVVGLGKSGGGSLASVLQVLPAIIGQAQQQRFGVIESRDLLLFAGTDPLGQALLAVVLAEAE
ncbi:MAG: hypothetical protein KJZ65_14195 [Phycisphaerales bacterium]|nr:hypothetical protein [Phycisphaerales bacterium]